MAASGRTESLEVDRFYPTHNYTLKVAKQSFMESGFHK